MNTGFDDGFYSKLKGLRRLALLESQRFVNNYYYRFIFVP